MFFFGIIGLKRTKTFEFWLIGGWCHSVLASVGKREREPVSVSGMPELITFLSLRSWAKI